MAIDFDAINAVLLGRARDLVPQWLPNGKSKGREWVTGDIHDSEGDSLSVNLETGLWSDFATGEGGKDLIALHAARTGKSNPDAARELASLYGITMPQVGAQRPQEKQTGPRLGKPPAGTPAPRVRGDHVYEYNDHDGELLNLICRTDEKAGIKKSFCQWSWDLDKNEWIPKGWTNNRPLYGLHLLKKCPAAPVLLVEGEKSAEVARKLVGDKYVVITWSGGALAWDKTNWTPLAGRNVTIWPDADEAGRKAAYAIAKHLTFLGCKVTIIDVADLGEGWDVADAQIEGWSAEKTFQWISERSKPYEAKTETATPVQPTADGGPGGSEAAIAEHLANSDLSLKMKWSPDGWRVWDGRIWELQKSKIPLPLQVAIRRALVDGLEHHKIELKNIAKLETAASMRGVADLLAAWPQMQMPTEVDPVDLIAFPRGVLNIRSGEWLDHDPNRPITKECPIDPGPDCDYWRMIDDHLRACLGPLYSAVHRFLGSSLLGLGADRRLLWLCGPGGDGKSTFAKILRLCLGDHCAMVAPEVFAEGTRSAHLHELSSVLAGARLGIALEVEPHRLNWELLKGLSGSDEQQTKRLHQKRFAFDRPPCLVLVSNSTPKPPDLASAQRIVLAELRPPDDQREDLMEVLKTPGASRDAIAAACLTWLIEGAQEYLDAGLGPIPLCGHAPGPLSRWLDSAVSEGRIDTTASTWTPLATIKQDLVNHWPAYPGEDLPHDRDLALFLKTKVQFRRTKTERLYRITVVTHGDGSGQVSHTRVKGSPDASPPVTSERSTADLITLADAGDEAARRELADRLCQKAGMP